MSAREVMQQALDALNLPSMKTQQMLRQRDEAIATLRAALEQPKREPLTEDEIRRMKPISPDLVDFRSGVRCAEAAHGIKGEV